MYYTLTEQKCQGGFKNHVTQNKLLAFQSRRLSCGTEDDYRRRRISCVQSCTSHHKEFCGTQHKPVAGPCAYYGRHFGLSAFVSRSVPPDKAALGVKRAAHYSGYDCIALPCRSLCRGRSCIYYGDRCNTRR